MSSFLCANPEGPPGHFSVAALLGASHATALTLCEARVSGREQTDDLDRQQDRLKASCAATGWRSEVVRESGAGMNDRKQGL